MNSKWAPGPGDLSGRAVMAELLERYAWAVDGGDWDLLRSCFTQDCYADYHLDGGRGLTGPDAVADFLARLYAPLTATQHFITNQRVLLDGRTASGSCYVLAQHVRKGAPGGSRYLMGAMYHDVFTETGDGWRIARHEAEGIWTEGNPAVLFGERP
jgi:SnoaL-like protein